MIETNAIQAVSFDFGQTLAELDTELLSARCAERGIAVSPDALDRSVDHAWRAYNVAIRAGLGGHPWTLLMSTLLESAGVGRADASALSEWLWTEQPSRNLWRRPIAGMIEVARGLRRAGVAVVVTSNSEGRLAALIDELGWTGEFDAVADSGCLGIEKPDPRIFAWCAAQVGADLERVVHVGDAWAADYQGALAAGMRAVLFRGARALPPGQELPERGPREACCDEPAALVEILRDWGVEVVD